MDAGADGGRQAGPLRARHTRERLRNARGRRRHPGWHGDEHLPVERRGNRIQNWLLTLANRRRARYATEGWLASEGVQTPKSWSASVGGVLNVVPHREASARLLSMGFWKANAGKISLVAVLLLVAGFFTYRNLTRKDF